MCLTPICIYTQIAYRVYVYDRISSPSTPDSSVPDTYPETRSLSLRIQNLQDGFSQGPLSKSLVSTLNAYTE